MRARFLSSTSLPKPSRRLSRWCALALAAAGAGAIAAAPAGQPGFEESTQVTLVQIPVQVTRGGEPVRGLSAADFEVYDGKTRQAITGFEVVDLASPANQRLAANVPAAARRHFLLLFDLAFSEPKSITKAQEAARDVMLKQLVPSDLVAVATYSHSVGARLVLGFTSDRRQVLAAITHFGLPELVDRSGDPLRLMADEYKAQLQSPSEAAASSKGPGGVLSQMLAQALEESARANERAERQNALQVVAAMTHSLSDLGNLMASVGGRKEVIYFSEGFDGSLLQGTTDTKEREDQAQSIAFGQTENVDSDVLYGNSHQNNEMEKMLESFRRSDCVIQSIDIAGLRGNNDQAAHGKNGEIVLFEMAKDTGGELFHSFNDLGEAMQRLLKQTSLTYVLNIQPAGLKSDGAYHKLRVELKSAPRGTQVSFRKGYYAPRPYTKESPMERDLAAASALMGGDRGGTVDVEVLAAPFHTTAEKAYVPVLIETDGASLLSGSTGTVLRPRSTSMRPTPRARSWTTSTRPCASTSPRPRRRCVRAASSSSATWSCKPATTGCACWCATAPPAPTACGRCRSRCPPSARPVRCCCRRSSPRRRAAGWWCANRRAARRRMRRIPSWWPTTPIFRPPAPSLRRASSRCWRWSATTGAPAPSRPRRTSRPPTAATSARSRCR